MPQQHTGSWLRRSTRWARRCTKCHSRLGPFSIRCPVCYKARYGRAAAAWTIAIALAAAVVVMLISGMPFAE